MFKWFIVFLMFPAALYSGWVGENYIGGTINPEGLVNETIFSYRISLADTNSFLLSDAHIDVGGFVSIFPVGSLFAGRVKFSPLLFLDIGFAAGAHACWDFYSFPDGTIEYGENVRDSMKSSTKLIPYISPFWIVKLQFGPMILYNSFFMEKFFYKKLWYYWYPELMVRDDWIFYWNSYSLFEISKKFFVMLKGHLQKSFDTGDIRYHLGPAARIKVSRKDNWLITGIEYHFKKVNFSGIKLHIALESNFSW